MLDNTYSSQGSRTSLSAGAGVPSPELENVPLPTPPYRTQLPPPVSSRRRPGTTLASPMVLLSRGWLRRHRPAVLVTAAAIGAAVLVVLLAAVAYHVTPSAVSEDYELDIEESEDEAVPLGHHNIEDELETSRPLVVESIESSVESSRPREVAGGERQSPSADGGNLVPHVELLETQDPAVGGPERPVESGAVLRAAVMRSSSRSRRHRTDHSSAAEPRPHGRFAEKPRSPQSLSLKQGSRFSQGGLELGAGPTAIQVEQSRDRRGKGLWKWAALPFDLAYGIELDEIGNSVSETIKRAGETHKPAEYVSGDNLGSDAGYQSKIVDRPPESNALESGSIRSETGQEPEESVLWTLKKWPLNQPLGQQERVVTVIKIPGIIKRQKRSMTPASDTLGPNVIQSVRKRGNILDSSLRKSNGKSYYSNAESSIVGGAEGIDKRNPFRGKRQIYWGPFYDPKNRYPGGTESAEDSSSEDVSDNEVDHWRAPYSWYYTPQTAHAQQQAYLPYGSTGLQYWPLYPPHPSYYRNDASVGQADFYRASSFQDVASAQQRSQHFEEKSEGATAPEEVDPHSRQMEKALETSVVSPLNISTELFSRAMKSKTPTEFADILRQISDKHMSNLRQSHPDGCAGNDRHHQPGEDLQKQIEEMEPTDSSSEEDTSGRAAESGISKLFTAVGIVKLINVLPSDTIKKIIESLSAEALADLLKGLSKEEIATIKDSLPPEKLEAIKKMFSPEELEEVKEQLGINSNVTATTANGQPVTEVPKPLTNQTPTKAHIDNAGASGKSSAAMPAALAQRQVEALATSITPEILSSQTSAVSTTETVLEEHDDDDGPNTSTYAPLTVVPETSTDITPVSQRFAEEAEPEDESARSFLRRNGTRTGLQKQLRPGLMQLTIAAMNSPAAALGMSQLSTQDQRIGREQDTGNPLDAVLAAGALSQRQQRVDPSDAILSTLTALAEDVHWIRLRLDRSNTSLLDTGRSSLLDAELDSARRAFLQHTMLSGHGMTALDRERLAALPPGLADQLQARQAANSGAVDYLTGVGGDYTGAVEATASTAYTVTSPEVGATTPKTWAHGYKVLTAKPGVTVPGPNTGIHFPSQPTGSAFGIPAAHKTLESGHVVPLPIHSSSQHVPVCVYGHQQQLAASRQALPQAAAFASAVAFVPQLQPQPHKPTDKSHTKDLPVLHHQQNVYNYYSGVAPAAAAPWPLVQRQQSPPQQQQLALPQPVFCGWLPSLEAHFPLHSAADPFVKPYLGWRSDGGAGAAAGAAANSQQSAVLQAQPRKADEAAVKQPTTEADSAGEAGKPLMGAEPPLARDAHADQGKSGPGAALGESHLVQESGPADSSTERQATGWKRDPNSTATPCCGGTTGAADESERASLTSGETQRFASEVRPLQGTHAATLSGVSATPSVPVLPSADGQDVTNR